MESIGESLKALREDKGVSKDAIAEGIKAKPHIINALEENKILDIVAHTYAKGYIKAYCSFLGVDSEPILEQFNKEYSSSVKEIQPVISILQRRQRSRDINWIRVSVVIIFIIAALYFVFNYWGFWQEIEQYQDTPEPADVETTGSAEPETVIADVAELGLWVEATDDVHLVKVYRDGVFIGDERISRGGKSGVYRGSNEIIFEIDNGAAARVVSLTERLDNLPEGKVRVVLTPAALKWEAVLEEIHTSETSSDTE